MRKLVVFLSLFMAVSSPLGLADPFNSFESSFDTDTSSAISIFEGAFFDPRIYHIADCNTNVWRLLKRLDAGGVDLANAKVLYIYQTETPEAPLAEQGLVRLHPLRAKVGLGSHTVPWLFHVNLAYGDTVLDLDYRHWPHPEREESYFSSMFSAQERSQLYIREIPAAEYLKEYEPGDTPKNWRYFLFDPDHRYSSRKLPLR